NMASDEIELSFIIITYNTKKIVQNCLESIQKSLNTSSLSYEIIVVDNASTDGTIALLTSSRISELRVIQNTKNLGFAKANNQGVREARGKYILLLNSDTIVLDNAIEKLLHFYKQKELIIQFLGGKLLNKDHSPQPSCGPFYSLPVIFGALFLKGDYWEFTRYSPNIVKEVDWVSGACILTKKEYYETIGGFDEQIFMYMDEIDLLYRVKQKGYKVFFYPDAQFIHLGSASSKGRTYPILQVYRGFMYFYKKHHNDRLSLFLLKFMLQLKSWIAIGIGKLTRNPYLIKTYEEALKLAEMA
ncbi:glycosyltransferase family 2 protein, partial [Candidatus Roizmanbacteria bacterium]|nr:glycosyltransferase family 2 protein [Candidatus Roizmanbacteria bacterium]